MEGGCIVLTGKKEILYGGVQYGRLRVERESDRGAGSMRSWKILFHEEEPTVGLWKAIVVGQDMTRSQRRVPLCRL